MLFENLKKLSIDMWNNRMACSSFAINCDKHLFACIFVNDYVRPLLLVTSLGRSPFTIRMEGDKDFQFDVYLGERYRDLISYLEIRYDPDNKFHTKVFFQEFDHKIPTDCNSVKKASYSEMARSVNNAMGGLDDIDRVYFYGWRDLSGKQRVSEANYFKTCAIVGSEAANALRERGVSSCWSDMPEKENLGHIGDYRKFLK